MLGWHRDPLATSEKLQIPNPKWRAVSTCEDKIFGPPSEALRAPEFVAITCRRTNLGSVGPQMILPVLRALRLDRSECMAL
jgi:hypothetical protein